MCLDAFPYLYRCVFVFRKQPSYLFRSFLLFLKRLCAGRSSPLQAESSAARARRKVSLVAVVEVLIPAVGGLLMIREELRITSKGGDGGGKDKGKGRGDKAGRRGGRGH